MAGIVIGGRKAFGLAVAALGLVAFGVGLEGAVVHDLRATLSAGYLLLALVAGAVVGVPSTGRLVRGAIVAVLAAWVWAIMPIPDLLRSIFAPGQARVIASLSPPGDGGVLVWLDALTSYDLMAALGPPPPWTFDVLAGAPSTGPHPGASVSYLVWPELVSWVGCGAAFLVGLMLGRDRNSAVTLAIGLLVLGIGEALFGLVMRSGPSTGIGVKTAYLGSATGTLINRGHFASLMVISLGMTFGLMSALFPLVPKRKGQSRHRRGTSGRPPPTIWEASGDKLPRLVLLGFTSALLVVALVASQSRSPVLAVLAAAGLVGGWTWHRRDEKFHVGIFAGILAAGVTMAIITFGIRGAFGRFIGVLHGDDVSLTSRLDIWKASLKAFADAPIFGHGPGNWRAAWTLHEKGPHLYDFQHAHSEVFQQLVDIGLVGSLGVLVLLGSWLRACMRRLDVAPQDARTALGVGGMWAVVAIGLQSLVDFPLHTPGIGTLTFLVAGLSLGALTDPTELWKPLGVFVVPPVLAGWWLAGSVAAADDVPEMSREERLSERPTLYYEIQGRRFSPAELADVQEQARTLTREAPLSPWAWLTLGLVDTIVLGAPGEVQPEDLVLEVDRAVTRAVKLRPRDPRVLEIAAAGLIRASRAVVQRDALLGRGELWLAKAAEIDPWRAEAVFKLAEPLNLDALGRIAAAGTGEGTGRARVHYEYGRALERRNVPEQAMLAFRDAANRDRNYGPPAFAAGILALEQGDLALADRWFERFLEARERPGGMEGWARYHRKDFAGAEVQFRRVLAENPDNKWSLEGIAAICRARGDAVGEITALQRLLELNPKDKRIRARLDELESTP